MTTHAAIVDLRSDTVTRPTAAMWDAMRSAPLGDDVLGDEPTVAKLEQAIARRTGKEAAVYVPSGTMANQLAIRVACGPGDEIIAHEESHIIHYETGAPAALSGAMVRTVRGDGGLFDAADVAGAVRTPNVHHPISKMLVAENTQNRGGGTVWRMDRWERVSGEARKHGLHVHVDGARLFNACVAGGYAPDAFARHADTLCVCFSMGLGCPVGCALCGPAAFIERARRFRKMFGGGMRQSGLLAAAALHALDHHVARLADDHALAQRLADGLRGIDEITVDGPHTNMVFVDVPAARLTALDAFLAARGIAIMGYQPRLRLVTHLDVDAAGIDRAVAAFKAFFAQGAA